MRMVVGVSLEGWIFGNTLVAVVAVSVGEEPYTRTSISNPNATSSAPLAGMGPWHTAAAIQFCPGKIGTSAGSVTLSLVVQVGLAMFAVASVVSRTGVPRPPGMLLS